MSEGSRQIQTCFSQVLVSKEVQHVCVCVTVGVGGSSWWWRVVGCGVVESWWELMGGELMVES